jgi:soluble lytic murein transglycosylase
MIGLRGHSAIIAAVLFGVGLFAEADARAKAPSIALPDRNPKRTSARQAEQLGHALPNEKPEPPGVVADLPKLLEYPLINADKAALKEAVRTIYKRRFDDARASMKRIKDKTALKLATWYYYRRNDNDAAPDKIERFRLANPDWPSQRRLRRNAEKALLTGKYEPKTVIAFFEKSRPTTGAGKAALGGAHHAMGEEKKGQHLIQEAWRRHELGTDIEKIILDRYGNLLTPRDHKARVDRLLLLDRKSKIAATLRAAALLGEKEQKKIDARIAVVRRLKTAKKLLADIPEADTKDDVGFYFSRIQWLRRHDKEKEAWDLLLAAPREPDDLIAIDEWWIERRVNCRMALNAGHPEIAYRIARDHEPISGTHYNEAEFLAGWIALRFLGKPHGARQHFLALRTAAIDNDEVATAEYWLGRAAAALKDDAEAKTHYEAAARFPLSYYGQLARQQLTPGPTSLPLTPAPVPTEADFARFKSRDAVQTIGLINSVDLEKLAPLFFHHLARTIDAPAEAVLLAKLAEFMDQPHASVRLSKIAFNRELPLAELAYPVNMLPDYKEINVPVEEALLYALSRQESEFNPSARSPVGARGLMQIMPLTARAIARQHKVRYRQSALTRNPSYNMMLGVAHLGDLLNNYDGSYILTLVAYNAGPGRVRDWTEEFGDPRSKDVDAIDWVERIPFTETRNYVKKILTGVQIFRSRLNGPDKALRLYEDLNRGSGNQPG